MSFLIGDAWAEGAAAAAQHPQGGGWEGLIPLLILFVIFYFLLIRPQQKKVKEHKQLVESLKKGDEVTTFGGLVGKIRDLDDNFVDLEVASGVVVKVERQNIARLLPKGTLAGKAAE